MKEIKELQEKNKLRNISPNALGELISIAQHRIGSTIDYIEIANFIKQEFHVNVTRDDVVDYFTPIICEIESELLYKNYGYDKTI